MSRNSSAMNRYPKAWMARLRAHRHRQGLDQRVHHFGLDHSTDIADSTASPTAAGWGSLRCIRALPSSLAAHPWVKITLLALVPGKLVDARWCPLFTNGSTPALACCRAMQRSHRRIWARPSTARTPTSRDLLLDAHRSRFDVRFGFGTVTLPTRSLASSAGFASSRLPKAGPSPDTAKNTSANAETYRVSG